MDILRHKKIILKDEHKGRSFSPDSAWEILRACPNWDASDLIPILTVKFEGTSGGNAEPFGEDKRPRPPGARVAKKMKSESSSGTAGSQTSVFTETMSNELRLKRESAQEKVWTVIKFEELRFLATKTDGLLREDLEIIEMQKEQIRAKYRCH
ncbi:hypothetical protein Tco_0907429 [Tanacetum coccineum]|uniref:No apical meristem-associated C-terminal domain-containing protein n=1 Tax=Tanacetum coccineum TaxID=301880 RepID=A0ABQ5CKC1_9ASTR